MRVLALWPSFSLLPKEHILALCWMAGGPVSLHYHRNHRTHPSSLLGGGWLSFSPLPQEHILAFVGWQMAQFLSITTETDPSSVLDGRLPSFSPLPQEHILALVGWQLAQFLSATTGTHLCWMAGGPVSLHYHRNMSCLCWIAGGPISLHYHRNTS